MTRSSKRQPTSAFTRAWTVLRVRGVPIRIDISWVLIAGLVVYTYATRFADPDLLGRDGRAVVVTAAGVAAVLFFASLLAHELGHAITNLDRGIPVLGVTLFLLGGVTESVSEARRARDEFVIVGIGPFISLVLAALFSLLHLIDTDPTFFGVVTGYLAWTNLALAVFNLLPGYPLDGGRLLRAILWGATGSPHKSTRWAARVGQVFAWTLIAGGANGLLDGPVPGSGILRTPVLILGAQGLWGILIGFFLLRGAVDAHRRAAARERIAGQSLRQIMGDVPPTLPADLPLDAAIRRLQERPSLLWPVGSPLRAAVRLIDLDAVAIQDWPTTQLVEVARSAEDVTVDVGTPLDVAIERLADVNGNMLIVVDHGHPVGLLTPSLVAGLTG